MKITSSPNIPEKDKLTVDMENIITIDGRGRPEKARTLILLIEAHGIEEVIRVLGEFGKRRFF